MSKQTALKVAVRTKFGKGAARQDRRAGFVPAVLYGHGNDPQHLNLPAKDLASILRSQGINAIINLEIEKEHQLALTKTVVVHPLRNYIEHVDLLIVRRGEKVTVEVAIVLEGSPAPGTTVVQDLNSLEVSADPMNIPNEIVLDITGKEVGTQILAADLNLPKGVELLTDPETLVVNITEIEEADLGDSPEDEDTESDESTDAQADE